MSVYSLKGGTHRRAHIRRRLRADMPASFINDPEHWRRRAEEARTIAEQMSDSPSKEAMLRIAKDYERLAERGRTAGQGCGTISPRRRAGLLWLSLSELSAPC